MKQVISILIFTLAWLNSCSPETQCDTTEAGLNTFSMNGEPIHAFINGETDAEFVLERYFRESGSLEFVLYDLCNQRTSITLNMTVIHPSY